MKKMLSITLVMALTLFAFAGYAADKAPKAKAPEKAAAKAPADQEQIAKVLDQWKAAALAGDLDKAMAVFSDKFKNDEQGDKAGVKAYLKGAFDDGSLKNMELDTTKAKTNVDSKKNTATLGPITLTARFGSATVDLTLAKEGGKWLVTGMKVKEN